MNTFITNLAGLLVAASPWLLFGYVIAGIINSFVSQEWLQRHLGENNITAVIKSAFIGAPLPLCSCGVVPAALGLYRAGASKASTIAFLISTPETGVDSVPLTHAMMGPVMAVIRPVAAITTAIITGLLVMTFADKTTDAHSDNNESSGEGTVPRGENSHGCCSSRSEAPAAKIVSKKTSSCCSVKPPKQRLWKRMQSGLRFAFVDLMKDTSIWLLIGFVVAALITTFVPTTFLQEWGSSVYAYLIMAVIGVPMYICATASTPVAASFLFAGVSPGAVLVFLLVGPATNMSTLALAKKELGMKVLALYVSCVVGVSFLFAIVIDILPFPVVSVSHYHAHNHDSSIIGITCAVIMVLLLVRGIAARCGTFKNKVSR